MPCLSLSHTHTHTHAHLEAVYHGVWALALKLGATTSVLSSFLPHGASQLHFPNLSCLVCRVETLVILTRYESAQQSGWYKVLSQYQLSDRLVLQNQDHIDVIFYSQFCAQINNTFSLMYH